MNKLIEIIGDINCYLRISKSYANWEIKRYSNRMDFYLENSYAVIEGLI